MRPFFRNLDSQRAHIHIHTRECEARAFSNICRAWKPGLTCRDREPGFEIKQKSAKNGAIFALFAICIYIYNRCSIVKRHEVSPHAQLLKRIPD